MFAKKRQKDVSPATNCANPQIELDQRHVVHTMVNCGKENGKKKTASNSKIEPECLGNEHTYSYKCGKNAMDMDFLLNVYFNSLVTGLHVTDSS